MHKAQEKFLDNLAEIGVCRVPKVTSQTLPSEVAAAMNCVSELDDLMKWEFHQGELGRSVYSVIVTEISKGFKIGSRKLRRIVNDLVCDFYSAYNAVGFCLLTHTNIERVIVLNGRAPIQAGGAVAALKAGREVQYLEHGWSVGDSYRIEGFVSQNRLLEQQNLSKNIHKLNSESRAKGAAWLEEHQSNFRVNRFAGNFTVVEATENGHEPDNDKRLKASIFTSSLDEFAGYNDSAWPGPLWPSQEEAINWVTDELRSRGFDVVLRIHPNLMSKSWGEIRRVRRGLADWQGEMIGPANPLSSYEILRESDICFVWASTIGLEASANGIPVYVLYHSLYDLFADVQIVSEKKSLPENLLWHVDSTKAVDFAALSLLRGEPVTNHLESELFAWFNLQARSLATRNRVLRIILLPVLIIKEPYYSLKICRILLGKKAGSSLWSRVVWR